MPGKERNGLHAVRGGAEQVEAAAAAEETIAAGRASGNLIDRAWLWVAGLPRPIQLLVVAGVFVVLYPYSKPNLNQGVIASVLGRWPIYWLTCVVVFFTILLGGVWAIRSIPALLERRLVPKELGPVKLGNGARQAAQELPASARLHESAAAEISQLTHRLKETQGALERSEDARHRLESENEQLRQRLMAAGDF